VRIFDICVVGECVGGVFSVQGICLHSSAENLLLTSLALFSRENSRSRSSACACVFVCLCERMRECAVVSVLV